MQEGPAVPIHSVAQDEFFSLLIATLTCDQTKKKIYKAHVSSVAPQGIHFIELIFIELMRLWHSQQKPSR